MNTVSGWESRRIDWVPFYQCPKCGDSVEFLFRVEGVLAQCFSCQKSSLRQDFKETKRKRSVVTCVCGQDVPLTPSYCGWLGYICSCENYVAICYGNQALQPSAILSLDWNPSVCERGERLTQEGRLLFTCSRTKKDSLVVQVLQAVVKQEDSSFLFGDPKEYRAGLLLDPERRKYLGFLIWTEGNYAVLRQLFIVEDERRKGHAEAMVRHWEERYADRLAEKFSIEAPNEAALRLHIKLGHVRAEGDNYVGIKCLFEPPGI